LVLGAYGTIVSTLLAASQLLRDRPGVKLRLTPTNVEYAPEWKARRRFEKAIGGEATLIREWRPWRWRRPAGNELVECSAVAGLGRDHVA
jgi:hypothetical protein